MRDAFADVVATGGGFNEVPNRIVAFSGGPDGLAASPSLSFVGRPRIGGVPFGTYAAFAGDIDGDGYPDLLARGCDIAGGRSEYACVLKAFGARPPFPPVVDRGLAMRASDRIAPVGDVTCDGLDDVGVAFGGALTIVPGVRAGAAPPVIIRSPDPGDRSFAESFAGAGDVNGDGCDDLVVGAWEAHNLDGRVSVFAGSRNELRRIATITGPSPRSEFGISVAGVGDVDGDGFGDFAVGSHSVVWIYRGGIAPASTAPTRIDSPTGASANATASAAGDLNGDGFGDIIARTGIGVYGGGGAVRVALGSDRGVSTADAIAVAGEPGSVEAARLAGVGDVDGDEFDDLVQPTSPEIASVLRGSADVPRFTRSGATIAFHDVPAGGGVAQIAISGSILSAPTPMGDGLEVCSHCPENWVWTGFFPTPEEAVANEIDSENEVDVDVDGDGSEDRLVSVGHRGFVVLRHAAAGWQAILASESYRAMSEWLAPVRAGGRVFVRLSATSDCDHCEGPFEWEDWYLVDASGALLSVLHEEINPRATAHVLANGDIELETGDPHVMVRALHWDGRRTRLVGGPWRRR